MDKIWDRKSLEVVAGWKKRMTTQNRQKSNAKKQKQKAQKNNNKLTKYPRLVGFRRRKRFSSDWPI